MTVDCQWIERNLEGLFCGTIPDENDRLARKHIEGCPHCRQEVTALNAIDPLLRKHFRQQMAMAYAPKRLRLSVVYAGASAALVAALLLPLMLRAPQPSTTFPVATSVPQSPVPSQAEVPSTVKSEAPADTIRTKPAPPAAPALATSKATPAPADNALDFLVTDPAGYSRNLEYYRGHVLLIGVWSTDQPSSPAALEHLYKIFGPNTKFRLIGVTNEREAKPRNTTFPVVYNQGSKLFGAQPGEFVLIDAAGNIRERGSLTQNSGSLEKSIRAALSSDIH